MVNVTKTFLKHPTHGAKISVNDWNLKTKIKIHPDIFLEFISAVFPDVDYWMSYVQRKFNTFLVFWLQPINIIYLFGELSIF